MDLFRVLLHNAKLLFPSYTASTSKQYVSHYRSSASAGAVMMFLGLFVDPRVFTGEFHGFL